MSMKTYYLVLLLLVSISVFSQQEISLYQQYDGSFDFSAFGNTLNLTENGIGANCDILSSSSANFSLQQGQTLEAAYLYWAGAGASDLEVTFNGESVSAERDFNLQNSDGLSFFSAFANVTSIIANNTSGSYTLSNLDLNVSAHCDRGLNFGGWSVIVIYQDPTLAVKRQVSIFDGFQFVDNSSPLSITLDFLSITDTQDASIGFLSWEGDRSINVTETLSVNGNTVSDPPLNPADNVFNGTNTYTGSDQLYNMDIDRFEINDFIAPGDETIGISLVSGQDFVIVNNIVATYNSELDLDATIEIDDVFACGTGSVNVDYTVFNQGNIGSLPPNTPIAFYANDNLVGQAETQNSIPIGASENGVQAITIPSNIPRNFVLKAVVDDTGDGTGIVDESDETNNEASVQFQLPEPPSPVTFEICDYFESNDGVAQFNLQSEILIDLLLGNQDPLNITITFFTSRENAIDNQNPLPEIYTNNMNPESIFARITEKGMTCYIVNEVVLQVILLPEFTLADTYRLCVDMAENAIPEESGQLSPPIIDTGLDPLRYTFTWFLNGEEIDGQTNAAITVTEEGEYMVTVTDTSTGCSTTVNTTVYKSSPPFNYEANVVSNAFSETHSIEVTTAGFGDYTFALNDNSPQDDGIFTNVAPGLYRVTISDKNGCGTVVIDNIAVIDYPKYFTPNGDGYHDKWRIENLEFISQNANTFIFDRFGKLLKQLKPDGEGWDGNYNSNPMPSSDYWFRVEYTEEGVFKQFRGHFALKR